MKCKVIKAPVPGLSGKTWVGQLINLQDADAERLAISGFLEIIEKHKASASAIKQRVAAALNKNKNKH